METTTEKMALTVRDLKVKAGTVILIQAQDVSEDRLSSIRHEAADFATSYLERFGIEIAFLVVGPDVTVTNLTEIDGDNVRLVRAMGQEP